MKEGRLRTPTRSPVAWIAAAAAFAVMAPPASAAAGDASEYIFQVDEIKAGDEVPGPASREIRTRLGDEIDSHDRLHAQFPAEAPDPDEDPEGLERFLDARDLSAYDVHVEVTSYRAEVDENPDAPGHIVTVAIGLRVFGEGIPRPTMDFSGEGSATVMVPTGRRVRNRDRAHAHKTAIEQAVSEGIMTSLRELDAPRS